MCAWEWGSTYTERKNEGEMFWKLCVRTSTGIARQSVATKRWYYLSQPKGLSGFWTNRFHYKKYLAWLFSHRLNVTLLPATHNDDCVHQYKWKRTFKQQKSKHLSQHKQKPCWLALTLTMQKLRISVTPSSCRPVNQLRSKHKEIYEWRLFTGMNILS